MPRKNKKRPQDTPCRCPVTSLLMPAASRERRLVTCYGHVIVNQSKGADGMKGLP
ncbi:MAG: hypothetical protein LBQ54_14115 [Planctomycetaceae bacterium]|nr:hypothetical protein [Planctomycetaceae bacterium]